MAVCPNGIIVPKLPNGSPTNTVSAAYALASNSTIARGIRSPRVPRYDVVPRGPRWRDVRRLIRANSGGTPGELRARAIVLLCSIYATRSIEIANLALGD